MRVWNILRRAHAEGPGRWWDLQCECPMYLPLSSALLSLSGYAGLAISHHVYYRNPGDRAGALLGAVLAGLCRSCGQGNGRDHYHRLPLAKFNN